ncbi:hypothetical protein LTR10_012705 [Elasticomyces elasticus]|uniref:Major facilitator superfamily (MFS) profile domain-containing protein n=1 Tax=Exophiala sideris TaxID=1016849 RepID=A0ABR0JSP6_9EURO|nr:hypothetical protein LTR10_012705 [Elasticomyces elasticus]KAK5034583.1 hypothetical protein LTR13_006238 [Exophiala sideris]KAK5040096.1 hypothetical protein LTS07_000593 [Exophiala sideris]KAK5068474.1 hypothetical protein LTR69_000594 [Exophiala sideris]KAK5187776.1 hypothetical protein LTR44_000594 [Eurotiomycetes sp. CCFEE 6388]
MATLEKDLPGEKPLQPSSGDEEAPAHINEKALVRRLDRTLLPALTFLYLLSFLDRSNVGNARVEGLATDLHMTGDRYLTGLTLYFIGYVLFEVPANMVLKTWTPRAWLPTLTLVWGIVSTLMGVIQSRTGFFIVRFFLGVAEAGLFPGIVFYLSMWYKRNERQYRVALFFSAASLAGAFGGILAWGIAHMKGVGGYNGWRWIFILEGLLTVIVSAVSYLFIHNYPNTAKFLSDDERLFVQNRLKEDSDATADEKFNMRNVKKAFTDIKVYLYALAYHTMSLPLYTLSLFLPTIISSLGYTAAQAQLMTIPPYAIAFFLTVGVAILSERYQRRAPFILVTSSLAILGYILLLSDPRPGVSYLGTIFAAAGIYPSVALVLSWPANNVSGQTKRAIANAIQISIGNCGAVIGTQLYRTESSPRFFLGHSFALGYLVANLLVTTTLWWVLKRENERRQAIPVSEQGEGPWLGDEDLRWRFHL